MKLDVNNYDIKLVQSCFDKSNSVAKFQHNLFGYSNTTTYRFVKILAEHFKLDLTVLVSRAAQAKIKYYSVELTCPVCDKIFTVLKGAARNKTTCSHSCANTYFRSGLNNGDRKYHYRTICFHSHKKECVVCKEHLIIEVHHYDGDNRNNNPENLIPLCPTHHGYWHSKHRPLIEAQVIEFRKNFIESNGIVANVNHIPEEKLFGGAMKGTTYKPSEALLTHAYSTRKAERPPYEQLLKEVADTSYCATGRKYEVSDNAIRKWLKSYEAQQLQIEIDIK